MASRTRANPLPNQGTVPFGIAHRGGADVAPGNTMAAFERAVDLGYTTIETDVRATADGVLVVFHDDTTQPVTGRPGTIEGRTWAEVNELYVGDSHPIPRFEDVVNKLGPRITWNVEPKAPSAVAPFVEAVKNLDLGDRVCVGSFSDRIISQVGRLLGPNVARAPGPAGVAALSARGITHLGRRRSQFYAMQVPVRYGPFHFTSAHLIKRIHRLGLQVHVWTVNDETEMEHLLDLGVDAIMTDEVALLREVLRRRGQWPADDHTG
ncbi:MAG: glycerophosphodiester phosphodiesterase family protein [Acidimicrobiales bacterium]